MNTTFDSNMKCVMNDLNTSKTVVITPCCCGPNNRVTVTVIWDDLVITVVEGEANKLGDVYGCIYDVDKDGARGGYECYLNERLEDIGMPIETREEIFKNVLKALED